MYLYKPSTFLIWTVNTKLQEQCNGHIPYITTEQYNGIVFDQSNIWCQLWKIAITPNLFLNKHLGEDSMENLLQWKQNGTISQYLNTIQWHQCSVNSLIKRFDITLILFLCKIPADYDQLVCFSGAYHSEVTICHVLRHFPEILHEREVIFVRTLAYVYEYVLKISLNGKCVDYI